MSNPFTFVLPEDLSAKQPPEKRGIARDAVRLMVIDRKWHQTEHSHFHQLHEFLKPGDLLVFNSSRTIPASLQGCEAPGGPGRQAGPCMEVRLAEHLADETWLALLLCRQGEPFACGLRSGMQIDFGADLKARVLDRDKSIPRLWKLSFTLSGSELIDTLYKIGQPVRYEYLSEPWPLEYYQNVYAKQPGSAEMPSAGRAFTWKVLLDLKRRGIETCDIVLHTGLSCYMDDELDAKHPASEEEYFISEAAAEKIADTRARGGRVVAVGTTVVRTLESAINSQGVVEAGHSYTKLHIDKSHKLRAVDGLITGLHEPEASHLDLLNAFLPSKQIIASYTEAIALGYLWHEFGDLNLII